MTNTERRLGRWNSHPRVLRRFGDRVEQIRERSQMARMFDFDPTPYAAEFAAKDCVHIPRGLSSDFLATAGLQVCRNLEAGTMENFAIGDKQQAMYDFPDDAHLEEFLEIIGRVCGLDPTKLVVSERHIKAYEGNADPDPLVHKDRFATQVAVGFSVKVPAGSTLVIYPDADNEVNLFNSSTEMRASLRPERLPERTLAGGTTIEIEDKPGDIVLFRGNMFWHKRKQPAGTVMLYFKLNAYNCDPLAEDPRTPAYEARTLKLAAASDAEIADSIPLLGRRVDCIQNRYSRDWQELTGIVVWGEKFFTIDDDELEALKAMDGTRSLQDVVRSVTGGKDDAILLSKIRQLALRGMVDLLPATKRGDRPDAMIAACDSSDVFSVS